jgi:hypothetical protein
MSQGGNGWREGRDPIQRWLRIITSFACLGVFVFLAVEPERRDWPTLALALGAVLVLAGYEAIVRLPYLGRPDNPPPPTPPTYPTYQQYPPIDPAYTTTNDPLSVPHQPEAIPPSDATGDNPPPPGE